MAIEFGEGPVELLEIKRDRDMNHVRYWVWLLTKTKYRPLGIWGVLGLATF
jgi:hypothetical protein